MTIEDVEQTRKAWSEIAAGYDEFVTPTHLDLAEEGLRLVGLTRGMKFLDVACGTGALSIPAARMGAEVVATDLSSAMTERVSARAQKEGLSLEARVMDGHALEFDDDTFDVAGSQYGVMLFPDLPRGLSEMARVTSPGGKVVLIAFGSPEEVEFLGFMMGAMKAVVPDFQGLPMDPPPLPFQVADPDKLRGEMEKAGLKDVRVERTTEKNEYGSGQELWDWLLNSNPIPGMLVANLSEEQKAQVREQLDGMVRERSGGNGPAVLTNPVNIAIGSK